MGIKTMNGPLGGQIITQEFCSHGRSLENYPMLRAFKTAHKICKKTGTTCFECPLDDCVISTY